MYYKFDDKTRFLVIYQDVTKCVNSLVKYTKIPERTIHYWIEEIQSGRDIMKVKEGRGRKKTLTEEYLDRIEEEAKEDPLSASSRQLAAE